MSHDRFHRPILSADISAIYLAVELVLISPIKSADKIGRFYHSSVIDFRDQSNYVMFLLAKTLLLRMCVIADYSNNIFCGFGVVLVCV